MLSSFYTQLYGQPISRCVGAIDRYNSAHSSSSNGYQDRDGLPHFLIDFTEGEFLDSVAVDQQSDPAISSAMATSIGLSHFTASDESLVSLYT